MTEESSFAVVVALTVAGFVAGLAYTLQCTAQYDCVQTGKCIEFENSCSFSNRVTPAGYKIFNLSTDGALAAMTRGVCAAGLRQTLDAKGRLICVRAPSFPDAFNSEAADPDAATEHERACGKWIKSKSVVQQTEYFSFFDEESVADSVTDELKHEFDPELIRDDVDRFRAACQRMITNNAVAPAAEHAYALLKPAAVADVPAALEALGALASHYCDAPAALGVTFDSSGFSVAAVEGSLLDAEAASEALYAMEEASGVREKVRTFVAEMASAPLSLTVPPTPAQLSTLASGAIRNSWLDDAVTIGATINVKTEDALPSLGKFLYAIEETDLDHARAYLLAIAANCAFATRATTTGEFGANLAVAAAATRVAERKRRGRALGRLRPETLDRFAPINSSLVVQATTLTWSSLQTVHRELSTASLGDAFDACWHAATVAFPDALDERVLQKLTSTRLLDLLPPMIDELKLAVANELSVGRIAALVADPQERARLADAARSVHFKVAGAPRGSALGRSGDFERPALKSTDGALAMLLKQAKAVFLDRMALAIENADLCELPALLPSLSRNAYLLTTAPCSTLLPGILVQPFASDRFNSESLYGRIGYVIAHEIAHVASDTSLWDPQEQDLLLVNYSSSTHLEAAADLTAADALVASGRVSLASLCGAVSQAWCAREPSPTFWQETSVSGGGTHPAPNLRGDALCAWLYS